MAAQSFGKYVVTQRLGRGGMAEVYRARHPFLDREVAIKVILAQFATSADFEERFRREAKLVAALRHPNIVQLYDYDVAAGEPYMVMEYLEGAMLKDRLAEFRARGETIPLGEAARILDAVASALDYAHARDAIHRDVKPANILFTSADEPVLTDFGIAKIVTDTAQVSASGSPIGTPAYMSPEQAQAEPVDAHTDIYSLGVVLYEMATGRVPFQGDSPTAVMMQHLTATPPPPRDLNANIPEAVQAVILKALAKKPAERFATAGDLARAFRAALRGESAAAEVAATGAQTLVDKSLSGRAPWLSRLGAAAELAAPLVGRQAPNVRQAPRDRRSQLATVLGILGILFAALQFITQVFELLARPIGPLLAALPLLIALLFVASAALSLYLVVRSPLRVNRLRAGAFLAVLLIGGAAWGGWSLFNRLTPPSNFLVLISDFDRSKSSRIVDFPRRIALDIQKNLQDVGGNVVVEQTVEVYRDSTEARARGADNKATLVIWGWYDDLGVSPHVEMVRVPILARESVSVPFVFDTAAAAGASGLAVPRAPTERDLALYSRTPATISDFDLYVKNGPEQTALISTALLGLAFYLNGDSTRALALFDKALANPNNAQVTGSELIYFQRATVLYQQNRVADSVADLEKALALNPGLFEAHYNLAIAYSELCTPARQLERAIAQAQTAVNLRPTSANAHILLGDLYRQAGKNDQALAEFQIALKLDPNDAQIYQLLASAQTALGQNEAAKSAAQNALARREQAAAHAPADPVGARIALGDSYMAAANYAKALDEYRAAQKLAPDDGRVYRGLGNVAYWNKDLGAAENEYKQWANLAPKDATPHTVLGLLYMEQNRGGAAIAELQQATKLSACNSSAHLLLANIYYSANDYPKVEQEYQAALAIDPQNADAYYVLGVTQYLQDKFGDAVKSLQAAVALRPDLAQAHFALTSIYYTQKKFDQAAAEAELAVKYGPPSSEYYVAQGNAYEKLKRLNDAASAYQKALALKDDAFTRVYLGLVYFAQQNDDAALGEYQKALALDPQNEFALSGLGDVYARQGKWDQAAAAYQQSLARRENAGLRLELARVYARQGKMDAAIAEYQKALDLDPKNAQARLALGDFYASASRLDDAAREYQAALSVTPNDAGAHLALANVEYKRCNISTATREANAAVSLAPNSYYRAVLAGLYLGQGRKDDAAKLFAELRAAPPSDTLAHLLAGSYLFGAGNLADAEREFQAVLETPNLPALSASLAHDNLAQVYFEQDKLIAAESEFKLALAAAGSNADAQTWLGHLALRRNDAAAALAAYDRAVTLLPAYAQQISADGAATLAVNLQAARGLALARQNKTAEAAAAFDQAIASAQKLISQAPQSPLAHFSLASAYLARGDKAKADPEFAAAAQCDQSLAAARARLEANLAKLLNSR
ncbi:MAG: tetratricopeptide repeat protein [Chloroflexi bacterium]|nr:tetratricopeptide repeat protein [Chloroflexota bacterium]